MESPLKTIILPTHLQKFARLRHFNKGEIIAMPSHDPSHVYIIRSGLVKVYVINTKGDEFIHTFYGGDDVFPLGLVINNIGLNVFYETVTDCEIEQVDAHEFTRVLQKDAAFSYTIMQRLAYEATMYKARVDNLEYKYARERIVYGILLLAYRFGHIDNGILLTPGISQGTFCHMVNLSRESVSKGMKQLERAGMIARRKGRLALLDIEKLSEEISSSDNPPFFLAEMIKALAR